MHKRNIKFLMIMHPQSVAAVKLYNYLTCSVDALWTLVFAMEWNDVDENRKYPLSRLRNVCVRRRMCLWCWGRWYCFYKFTGRSHNNIDPTHFLLLSQVSVFWKFAEILPSQIQLIQLWVSLRWVWYLFSLWPELLMQSSLMTCDASGWIPD